MPEEKVKNMFEYLWLVAEDIVEQLEKKDRFTSEDVLPILQKWLNPFDPKPKDTFSPIKFEDGA